MDLDRGAVASIDRKLLAGLGHGETLRTLRVPATAAKRATWKRYCDAAGVSMGRAVATLMDRELLAVFSEHTAATLPVFAQQAIDELERRETKIEAREHEVDVNEGRLREMSQRLRRWENELEAREQRSDLASTMASRRLPGGRSSIQRPVPDVGHHLIEISGQLRDLRLRQRSNAEVFDQALHSPGRGPSHMGLGHHLRRRQSGGLREWGRRRRPIRDRSQRLARYATSTSWSRPNAFNDLSNRDARDVVRQRIVFGVPHRVDCRGRIPNEQRLRSH